MDQSTEVNGVKATHRMHQFSPVLSHFSKSKNSRKLATMTQSLHIGVTKTVQKHGQWALDSRPYT